MRYTKLWAAFIVVVIGSFAVLGYYGWEIYQQMPPVPARVVTTEGKVVFTGDMIRTGQNAWQSMGGQEVGSVWGHGAYVAPDWSADWLHRELTWIADRWSTQAHGRPYAELNKEQQAGLRARLASEIRKNTYDPKTGDVQISPTRAEAIEAVGAHYSALFGADESLNELRDAYAIRRNSVPDPERRKAINAFFFWAAWACATSSGKRSTMARSRILRCDFSARTNGSGFNTGPPCPG